MRPPAFGFSSTDRSRNSSPSIGSTTADPYDEISSGSTSSNATTDACSRSWISIMLRSSAASSTITSSPSSTAKDSFPTCWRATDTAWPRPSGSCWRTKWRSASSASACTCFRRSCLPFCSSAASSSGSRSKWSSIGPLPRPVTTRMSRIPARTASSTTYSMVGRSTIGSISLGMLLLAGKKRVPNPAAGITALRTVVITPRRYRPAVPAPARAPRPAAAGAGSARDGRGSRARART